MSTSDRRQRVHGCENNVLIIGGELALLSNEANRFFTCLHLFPTIYKDTFMLYAVP